jgi:GT2 family glycosyltransferase
MQRTSIIIVNTLGATALKNCIKRLQAHTDMDHEIIVVDCGSKDSSLNICLNMNVRLLSFPKYMEPASAYNYGARISNGDALLFLDSALLVGEGWLNRLIRSLYSSDEIGAVGANSKPLEETKYVNVSSDYDYRSDDEEDWAESSELESGCLLVKREILRQVGNLDDGYQTLEQTFRGYCQRVKAVGYRTMTVNEVPIYE